MNNSDDRDRRDENPGQEENAPPGGLHEEVTGETSGEVSDDPLYEAAYEDPADDMGAFDADVLDEDPEEGESVEVIALRAELEEALRERDEYLDSMRRLKAEFDNSRKRQERERDRILQSASERLILALLPVLDNLDRALDSEGDVRGGVKATREQLAEAMVGEGLLPVDSDGEHFDPNLHEAVMSQPSDEHEEGVVIQTFERGYTLNGRPIRPAKVVVSQ